MSCALPSLVVRLLELSVTHTPASLSRTFFSSFSFSICFSPSPISDRTYIMSVVACTDEFSIKPFTVAFSKSRRRFRSRKSSQITMRSSTGSSQM